MINQRLKSSVSCYGRLHDLLAQLHTSSLSAHCSYGHPQPILYVHTGYRADKPADGQALLFPVFWKEVLRQHLFPWHVPGHPPISRTLADFVAFLLLTGARFNEAARLTWDRVDFENKTWFLPDAKNRQSIHFPLSSQALKILNNRPKINEYVFFSYSKTGHVTDARDQMKKISNEIERKITAHDLRRTFRAVAAACGIELWRTKLLMNHTMREDITIRAYTEKGNLQYLAPDIQRIGDYIERQGTLEANKIVDLDIARKNANK